MARDKAARISRREEADPPPIKRGKKPVSTRHMQLHLPASTILKILVAALLVVVVLKLWTPFLIFLLSVLIALTLDPLVQWLERRGASRGIGVGIVTAAIVTAGAAVIVFVMPPLVSQVTTLADNYTEMRSQIDREFPSDWPVMKNIVAQVLAIPDSTEMKERVSGPLFWGEMAVESLSVTIVVLAMSVYLLIDGRRMFAWLVCYVPRRHRGKIAEATPPVVDVVRAYVRAQIVTSLICGVCVYVAMKALGVPGALPLAVLSAVLNIIPVLGSIVMAIPAVFLALSVSPMTALFVIAFHLTYNIVETYFIIPMVFGKSMRLSTLAVLLALLVGGILQGLLGMFLILPLVAAYPIVERIWLSRYLGTETVKDHKALTAVQGNGRKSEQRTVDTVLRGEEHPEKGPHAEPAPHAGTADADRALAGTSVAPAVVTACDVKPARKT